MICQACGLSEDDPRRFHADHIRPRWGFRADDERRDDPEANGQVLCLACHAVKSRYERKVWAFRERMRRRLVLGPLEVTHRPSLISPAALWAVVLGGLFLTGLVDQRWWWVASLVVIFNGYVCAKIAQRYRRHFGHSRGPGLNAVSDWDMRFEQAAEGSDGWMARRYYGWFRPTMRRVRYWPIFASCSYLTAVVLVLGVGAA